MDTLTKLEIFEIEDVLDLDVCSNLMELPVVNHHTDEEGHSAHAKNLCLHSIAEIIWDKVKDLKLEKGIPARVDPFMKIYKLEAPEGGVAIHTDENYKCWGELEALYSIIIYLNDDYTGGATIFEQEHVSNVHSAGSALVFAHDIPHEGRPVDSGVKYVLKTDLFVR